MRLALRVSVYANIVVRVLAHAQSIVLTRFICGLMYRWYALFFFPSLPLFYSIFIYLRLKEFRPIGNNFREMETIR